MFFFTFHGQRRQLIPALSFFSFKKELRGGTDNEIDEYEVYSFKMFWRPCVTLQQQMTSSFFSWEIFRARRLYNIVISASLFFRERFLRGYVTRAGQRLKPFMPSFSWCSLCLFFISLFFPSLLLELLFRGGHIAGQEYPSHMMKKKNDLKKK